jgi:hypothetical protein
MSVWRYRSANPPGLWLFAGVGLFAFGVTALPMLRETSSQFVMSPRPLEAARGSAKAPQAELTQPPEPTAEQTLRRKLELLYRGRAFLESTPGYTAQMTKQEVVNEVLLPEQSLFLKCRHRPFSVYLLWHNWDPGREVLYVEGQNEGKLIGHDGGWKARLPALSLSPVGALAMRDSRYPVTRAGFLPLMELMCQTHEEHLARGVAFRCDYQFPVRFDGRDCHAFTTTYHSPETSPQYRKSITLIDGEWNVPLSTEHFEWPRDAALSSTEDLDEATLIECYRFTDVNFQPLSDADFDRNNSEYAFR